ncbi:protein HEG-like isoform X1 [Oncorhynchus masou masou]|uniref:protein HEG-like isoform X1 n=1 Tax=Oncorhynchus masou masou TaxID=90313 RepID=UPI0031837C0E
MFRVSEGISNYTFLKNIVSDGGCGHFAATCLEYTPTRRRFRVVMIMETCYLSHVVLTRLSLLVLLVVLRPLNAWMYTSSSNDMDRVLVTGVYFSPRVTNSEEITAITALPKYLFTTPATSTDFREVSSPSSGTELHHRVRHSDESETRALSEDKLATEQNIRLSSGSTSWTSEGTLGLSTEQRSSTIVVSTEATTQWEDKTRLTPDHLPEAYSGLPAQLRALTETKRSVELKSVSVTEARPPQDSPDADSSLRVDLREDQSTTQDTVGLSENQSTNQGIEGLREDQSTNRGTVGLREDQSTTQDTMGLSEDQSTNRGTEGLREDQSNIRGTMGLSEDQSTNQGTEGLRGDQTTNRGTVGLREDQSNIRGTMGLSEDQSTNQGTEGLREDQSTNQGTVGLREDQSTNRGTVGLREDQSTNQGTEGLREDQSTNRGTVGLREDQSTNRGTVGLSEDQPTTRGTVGLREDQSTNRGTVDLREDQSTTQSTMGLSEDQSTNQGTVGLSEDQSTIRGTMGLREDHSTNQGTVGLGQGQSTDTLRQEQWTDLGTMALPIPVHTDRTYISSTMSRAGERTLLSVSSNSTTMYPKDSTLGLPTSRTGAGAGDVTDRIPSTGPDHGHDATSGSDSHPHSNTNSSQERPGGLSSRGTNPLTEPPNVTQQQDLTSLISEGTPYSTPPLSVADNHSRQDTDTTDSSQPSRGRTSQTEDGVPDSSQLPFLFSEGPSHPSTNTSQGGDRDTPSIMVTGSGTSTESSTGALSTQGGQGETEGVTSLHTEDTPTIVGLALTTAHPTLRESVTALDDSLSRFISSQPPFVPKTEQPSPAVSTEVLMSTTSVTVTMTSQVTEEETYRFTTATSTTLTPPLVTTRMVQLSTTSVEAQTQPTTIPTTITTETTLGLQTSASTPQRPATLQTQTQEPSTGVSITNVTSFTDVTTLYLETSTATPGNTTPHSGQDITTTTTTASSSYSHSSTTRSTVELHTTGKHTDRGTTEVEVTTAPMDIRSTTQTRGSACESNPCLNGGECGETYGGREFTCYCLSAWTGPSCNEDVDECEIGPGPSGPCPSDSTCVNTRGSFSCECPLGLDIENGRDCTRAKTFLGTFSVNSSHYDPLLSRSATLHEIQREINQLLNASLSILHGYRRSTLSKKGEDGVHISAVNMFSLSADVTSSEVYDSIQMSLNNCNSTAGHCRVVVTHQLSYQVESLCLAQNTQCHLERSFCVDSNGTAYCQCQPGYFKLNPEDQSCLECGDGLKRVNGTCVRCTFGFGGFNCGNFYKLIAVVVSPVGGALLLVLIIALIVTCCKKDKNDINKIIFKSGDFQMSPYAEFPKSNRVSMEWGREAIEMQENGSTKNLLQMTDIYYSPALRNSDLERNGLYPFSGLPGSRHSCIYPAQWNPSFINDDSRRRDYF